MHPLKAVARHHGSRETDIIDEAVPQGLPSATSAEGQLGPGARGRTEGDPGIGPGLHRLQGFLVIGEILEVEGHGGTLPRGPSHRDPDVIRFVHVQDEIGTDLLGG